jgi:phytoene/squalene synthetase
MVGANERYPQPLQAYLDMIEELQTYCCRVAGTVE